MTITPEQHARAMDAIEKVSDALCGLRRSTAEMQVEVPHSARPRTVADMCDQLFDSMDHLLVHVRTAIGPEPRLFDIHEHMVTVHGRDRILYAWVVSDVRSYHRLIHNEGSVDHTHTSE